jgi:hypothetical protein
LRRLGLVPRSLGSALLRGTLCAIHVDLDWIQEGHLVAQRLTDLLNWVS